MVFVNGLILGLTLTMSLGPQNIFLIRQGAHKNHATLSAIICFLCDITLVILSVVGLRKVFDKYPNVQAAIMFLGAAFLFYYAIKTLMGALQSKKSPTNHTKDPLNKIQIIALALGFSLLNPHAIIDTLIIIGSNSSQYPEQQLEFTLGVILASFIWFSSLTMTTRFFADVLTKKRIWLSIEVLGALLMIYIGIKLGLSGVY